MFYCIIHYRNHQIDFIITTNVTAALPENSWLSSIFVPCECQRLRKLHDADNENLRISDIKKAPLRLLPRRLSEKLTDLKKSKARDRGDYVDCFAAHRTWSYRVTWLENETENRTHIESTQRNTDIHTQREIMRERRPSAETLFHFFALLFISISFSVPLVLLIFFLFLSLPF